MSKRATVFVSYSHKDARWLERLQVHLRPYKRRGDLDLWDDSRIPAGDHWREAIGDAIDRAAAAILLISADFLASDFIASEELPRLLRKAQGQGVRVIPIIVQPCRLTNHPQLVSFQALNAPNRPLSKLSDAEAEEVFVHATEQVEEILGRHLASSRALGPRSARAHQDGYEDALFGELQFAVVALTVLLMLSSPRAVGADTTLTGLQRQLGVESRKLVHLAAERLAAAGWIQKSRADGRSRYRMLPEGTLLLRRLASTADGPLSRAAIASLTGSTPA